MKKIRPYIPLILILGSSILAWTLRIQNYINFESLRDHQNTFEYFIYQHYIWSTLIFSVIYLLIVGLSIPGATLMTVTAGFLFGQAVGTLLSVISATLGASLLFLGVRMASERIFLQKAKPWIKKMQAGFQENAFSYLMTLRLIPLFPFVAVNLVASILQIPLRTFFFGTLLGIIPGSFVYVSIGVALRDVINQPGFTPNLILDPQILLALGGLGVLALLPVVYKRFKKRK